MPYLECRSYAIYLHFRELIANKKYRSIDSLVSKNILIRFTMANTELLYPMPFKIASSLLTKLIPTIHI